MARYRAERNGFVNSHFVREGEEFEFNGAAPSWATPLEPESMEDVSVPEKKPARKLKTK